MTKKSERESLSDFNEVVQERVKDASGAITSALFRLAKLDSSIDYSLDDQLMDMHAALVNLAKALGSLNGVQEMPKHWGIE